MPGRSSHYAPGAGRPWRVASLATLGVMWLLALIAPSTACAAEPLRAAQEHQRTLTREARAVWGLDAPVPVFAAQIHQESAWRSDAESPYAQGLAQFTPATAQWITQIYAELGEPAVWSPHWAMRALVRYDRHIWQRQARPAATDCDRWAFTLSGYNGGPGWVTRDRATCRAAPTCPPCDPQRWWSHVERTPDARRAGWAITENRDYVRRVLLRHQSRYRHWGPAVACGAPDT